jgi:chorismate mutase/prephenate dehydratase
MVVKKKNKKDELRKEIDTIDNTILELLNKRASMVIEIGKAKAVTNSDFYVPERENAIYQRLLKQNKGPFPNHAIRPVFREIISASLSLEIPLKVAFLGPKATFTHLACVKQFGFSATFLPQKDIADVFDEVERGRAEYGIVPIENTTEGVVSHTLDMFVDSNLKINGEVLLEVSLALLSKTGNITDVTKVYSHTHALAQCKDWLKEHLPDVPIYDVASTALAAQTVADNTSSAAVASELAAPLYGLQVVEDKIEDNINNFTRFLIIGKKQPPKTVDDKTSIMFSIKDAAGALFKMLKPFADRGLSLTKIESRPQKKRAWEYVFFLDLDGHISDPKVKEALNELENLCMFLKILGSYPKSK